MGKDSLTGDKRLTVFLGHYGSGKTNVAVNYALRLREKYDSVFIADLDIVNPYFRTKDCEGFLKEKGIRLICSEYADSNVDVPAMPADAYSITDDLSARAVIDAGGDDRGALALGRYAPAILRENDFESLFVVNKYRPMTSDVASALAIMREIEAACGIGFTGIVNNSNLGEETAEETVLSSLGYADGISRATGLPIKMTSVESALFDRLKNKIENCFAIKLYVRQSWAKQEDDAWLK